MKKQCSEIKDAPDTCHYYYEMDENGKINVCRTGNPCKSKTYNKFSKRGIVMNKICTNFINRTLSKSSTRPSKSSKRSTSGGKKHCKTRRKKKTYKKVNKN